jgi:hypothetical protein
MSHSGLSYFFIGSSAPYNLKLNHSGLYFYCILDVFFLRDTIFRYFLIAAANKIVVLEVQAYPQQDIAAVGVIMIIFEMKDMYWLCILTFVLNYFYTLFYNIKKMC